MFFCPKFSKHWICVRKSVKTAVFTLANLKERRIPISKRKRDIDFHVYLNKDENQILENLCKRLRVKRSVLIRALILGKRLVEAPPVDYKQFIIELRRVGTNLNQLTAKANSIGYIDSSECENVLTEIRNLETDIAKYFKPGKEENRKWL